MPSIFRQKGASRRVEVENQPTAPPENSGAVSVTVQPANPATLTGVDRAQMMEKALALGKAKSMPGYTKEHAQAIASRLELRPEIENWATGVYRQYGNGGGLTPDELTNPYVQGALNLLRIQEGQRTLKTDVPKLRIEQLLNTLFSITGDEVVPGVEILR